MDAKETNIKIKWLAACDKALAAEAENLFTSDREAVQLLLQDDGCHLLVAYIEKKAAGYLQAMELRRIDSIKKQMLLYDIEVDPAFRRRGVATALIDELKRYCAQNRFKNMWVLTSAHNTAAMSSYKSTGGERPYQDDVMFTYQF